MVGGIGLFAFAPAEAGFEQHIHFSGHSRL